MNKIIPVELKNQRIMTTDFLSKSYEVEERKITDNFNNNKKRYEHGKHYFLLQGEELRQFKSDNENFGIAPNINKLYFWTEKGALLHAKSLNTDKAWGVYDQLVETYFRVRDIKPLSELEQLELQYKVLKSHEEQLVEVKEDVKQLKGSMTIDHGQACNVKLAVDLVVSKLCCGSESAAYQNKNLRSRAYRFVWKSIKEYFNITAYHNLLRKDVDKAINYVSNLKLQGGLLREVQ
ncbi:MAG: ORF6C domain-containing protein [Clostridium sp.]